MDEDMARKLLCANDYADWFINRADRSSGEVITPNVVQRLDYLAQAWHLANKGRPFGPDGGMMLTNRSQARGRLPLADTGMDDAAGRTGPPSAWARRRAPEMSAAHAASSRAANRPRRWVVSASVPLWKAIAPQSSQRSTRCANQPKKLSRTSVSAND